MENFDEKIEIQAKLKRKLTVYLSSPTTDTPVVLKQEDVWGEYDPVLGVKVSEGMIVARTDDTCPIFGDKVPYKSVTVVCNEEQKQEVTYWLEYVHGANSVSSVKEIEDNNVAIRSDYMCW